MPRLPRIGAPRGAGAAGFILNPKRPAQRLACTRFPINMAGWMNEPLVVLICFPRRADDARALLLRSKPPQSSEKQRPWAGSWSSPPFTGTQQALNDYWINAMCCALVPWLWPKVSAEPAEPLRQYLLPLPARPALPAAANHSAAVEPAESLVPPLLPSAADCFRVQEPPMRIPAPPWELQFRDKAPPTPRPLTPESGVRPRLRPLPLPAGGRFILPLP